MAEQVSCPVCDWKWEVVERCPCDGWELGEKWVLTPDPEAYERAYRERLERAREGMAQFKAGALGLGEEGLQNLRERLRALGLEPGPALEEWARQNLPGPFGGDCCLGITTTEEAEVFIDGYSVGTTRNCYLLVEHLRAGRHRVEAKARYGYGVVERELAPGDVQQCEIKVEPGKGFLRVLSEVGVLTLEVDGRSYRVPARIEVEAGRKLLTAREGNLLYEAEVEVLPGQVVEVRVTPEWLQDRVKVLTDYVHSVAFSPDGQLLASGSDDKTIRLWRVSDGKCLATLEGHTGWVRSVAFSPDGRLLASGSDDQTVRLWTVLLVRWRG